MRLLKFYTKNCCQCKVQNKMLEAVKDEIEIIPVDCDENNDLVNKYNIRSLPTLVLINDREEVLAKYAGITKPEVLIETINKQ